MPFGHKIDSSQQKFIKDFIHFKLIISNIIKTKQKKILPINGILLNEVIISNLLNSSLAS